MRRSCTWAALLPALHPALYVAVLSTSCGPPGPTEPALGPSPTADDAGGEPLASTGSSSGSTSEPDDPSRLPSSTTDTTTAEPEDTTDGEPFEPLPPGRFADVTLEAGLDAPHVAGGNITGQAWGDFDRDGHLDLFVTGGKDENRLFRSRGNGTFERVPLPAEAALPGPGKAGVTWADYDNDGWLDLYVAVLGPNRLLHNVPDPARPGERTFVAVHAGVEHPGHGRASAWGDYDGDGWLDLYVVNGGSHHDALYRGRPDGHFVDVSELVALPYAKPGYVAVFTDYDDDGDLDLYVVTDHHAGNDLWRNDGPERGGGWRFTNASESSGAGLFANAMGIAVGDYDGDGDLDLFTSDIHRTDLLRNELDLGFAGFSEVSAEVGVDHASASWGAVWLDADLDGWLDLYLATENAAPPELTNRLFRNRGNGTFEDATDGCGCADPGFSTGVAAADYDGDGAIDLVVGNYGQGYRLLHNELPPDAEHHWLVVELQGGGPVINRDALGARVTVTTTDGRRHVAERRSGSSLGAGDMLPLHFGLGAAEVREVEIRWPDADGSVTRHEGVATDAVWQASYLDFEPIHE